MSEDLSVDNIAVMHHALLNASDRNIAGEYRDAPVWIRGNSPHTAEAIVSALLRAKGITERVTIPVSSGLLTDTRLYFDALGGYRDGNIGPIVELFAESGLRAVDNSRQLAADIRATEADFASRVGDAPSSVRQVLELLPREPAVTADMVAEHAGISTATAYRAVERLEAAGILAPAGKIRGTSVWVAPDIIAALDAFAERTGHRTRH